MTTTHQHRIAIQNKYNALWTNQMLPTQEEQLEQDRRNAMRIVARAFFRDVSVKIAIATFIILTLVLIFGV